MAGLQQPQSSGLEKRAVVSSFIFHYANSPTENPVVALFKRSGGVRTYRHHIAPISGSISRKDKDPLSAAWREISEETQLGPSTLKFWRTGVPFTFSDESVGREWTVNPFAYLLKSPEEGGKGEGAIQTDWEHEGWQWYDPTAVIHDENLNGVPHLRESLRRVWFEGTTNQAAGSILAEGIHLLLNDHDSGARELTATALKIFRKFVAELQDDMEPRWWETVRMGAWHLIKNGRESMGAATLNSLLAVLKEIDGSLGHSNRLGERRDRLLSVIDSHVEARKTRAALVKDQFASYVRTNFLSMSATRDKLTIITLSSSSTIRDSIIGACGSLDIKTLDLRVLESRPLYEGVSIASSVLVDPDQHFGSAANKNLLISLYTDASAALASKDVDIVLLGADRISATKGVSNKTGSLPLVLSARHVSPTAKIVVLSDPEKVNGESGIIDDEKHEENDPREVIISWKNDGVKTTAIEEALMNPNRGTRERNQRVEVKNIYFEWVPRSLVDAFVSGEGILDDQHIREQSKQQGELVNRYFYSLSIWY